MTQVDLMFCYKKKIKKESLLDPEYEGLDFDCPKLFLWLINAVVATCR